MDKLNVLNKQFEKLLLAQTNPDLYVYFYFDDLINDIELRRKKTILTIHKHFDEQIEKINEIKIKLKDSLVTRNDILHYDIEKCKAELENLSKRQDETVLSNLFFDYLRSFGGFSNPCHDILYIIR